ncbi:hypothetical protein [Egbenema bharatensis]|uniref:hypothetical protein n=1 Tax=Egbenema bharatensis TaxID=3463334 RepID=UPI003A8A0327
MSAQTVLTLARQGDPRAIATLMNCITRPHQLHTRVQQQESSLHILFEAKTLPDQEESVEFACDSIMALELEHVSQLIIYGRQQGQRESVWQKVITLTPQEHPDSLGDRQTPTGFFDPFTTADEALEPIQADSEAPELLKRPEAVLFIIFVSIFVFWDAYLSLLEPVEPADENARSRLSTRQLAQRLNTTPTILRHKKRLTDFAEWSRLRDPEGLSWAYSKGTYSSQP